MTGTIANDVERLRGAGSEDEICRAAAELVSSLAGAPASVYLLAGDDRLTVRATTRPSIDEAHRSLPLSGWILEETARLERTVRIDDCADTRSASASGATRDSGDTTTNDCRSVLLAPVPGWGLVVATDDAVAAFDDRDEAAVGLAAELLAARLNGSGGSSGPSTADERLDRVASILSHDLGNPLTVARAYVQHAMETGETDRLDDVLLALDRVDEITSGVETFARTGRTLEAREPVDLLEAAEVGWSIVETGGGTLKTEAGGTFLADEARLYQLFENLFANAVQHGGGDVTVRVGVLPNGSGFFVEDDGPGIPEERREMVFDHGYSRTEDQSGFGLSIVRAIAEAHGWEICVVDGQDGGARFEVTGVSVG